MAIAVTLTHISQRLDAELVASGNLIWRCAVKADTIFDLTFDARQNCSKSNFSSRGSSYATLMEAVCSMANC